MCTREPAMHTGSSDSCLKSKLSSGMSCYARPICANLTRLMQVANSSAMSRLTPMENHRLAANLGLDIDYPLVLGFPISISRPRPKPPNSHPTLIPNQKPTPSNHSFPITSNQSRPKTLISTMQLSLTCILAVILSVSASPLAQQEDTSPALLPRLSPAGGPAPNSLCTKETGEASRLHGSEFR